MEHTENTASEAPQKPADKPANAANAALTAPVEGLNAAPITSRDSALALLKALPRPQKRVATDIGTFIVQGLSATERDAFESTLVIGKGKKQQVSTYNIRAKLVARCIVDESGKRLFTDEDAVQLGQVPVQVIGPLYDAAQELSSVSDDDIEELAGNSDSSRSDSSH